MRYWGVQLDINQVGKAPWAKKEQFFFFFLVSVIIYKHTVP